MTNAFCSNCFAIFIYKKIQYNFSLFNIIQHIKTYKVYLDKRTICNYYIENYKQINVMLQQYSKAVYGRVETTWHIQKAGVNVASATVAHYVARPLVIPGTVNKQYQTMSWHPLHSSICYSYIMYMYKTLHVHKTVNPFVAACIGKFIISGC